MLNSGQWIKPIKTKIYFSNVKQIEYQVIVALADTFSLHFYLVEGVDAALQIKITVIMPLKFAVVCSSNQNRSMEAHNFMSKRGLIIKSFGSGAQVKLPGPSLDRPNIYTFDTSYEYMYKDLIARDQNLYTQNGVLHMLDRNRRIKEKPERFQDCRDRFDIVFTVEERIFDQVLEDLDNRDKKTNELVHIINIDVADNPEDATLGAFMLCDLGQKMEAVDDLDNEIDEILTEYESKIKRPILHAVSFY
ncbi:unnamed protein product [Didymodactylos carnosus]|uniref:RNA polymerase II subunit A C-terminal domain phosphatase SSU72 n=1 Tax=Didymodactylos carnosus TaxID=1234261 RepID=A0A814MI79_9BILA|nr:unnamed protein product [Didymodactylos carnosus]CAF3843234.1 unnamed protein product [Didymodactylos carnosus]